MCGGKGSHHGGVLALGLQGVAGSERSLIVTGRPRGRSDGNGTWLQGGCEVEPWFGRQRGAPGVRAPGAVRIGDGVWWVLVRGWMFGAKVAAVGGVFEWDFGS